MVLQLLDSPFQAATSPAAAIRRRAGAGAGARGFAARWGLLIGFVVLSGAYFLMHHVFYAQGVVGIIIELVGGSVFLYVILRKGRL